MDSVGRMTLAGSPLMMTGAGQVEPSAFRVERFTRFSLFTAASSMGVGEQMSTNVSTHLDARVFGNLISVTTNSFSQRDTRVAVDLQFANIGAAADFYPLRKPLRLSGGYLFYNANRIRADVHAGKDAVLTINNTDFYSDNADPVYGTGRAALGGRGFLLTTGYGRIVSRSEKHFSFPFEAGVAFINIPRVAVDLFGSLCSADGTNCQPTATYPGFQQALAAQVAEWNRNASPYHIYPIIQGGVAYTFRIRSR